MSRQRIRWRPSFAPGDTITVNGTPITFVASGATGNQLNVTDSVQTLLAKIDSITGTTTPSTVNGGAITLHGGDGANLTVTSSNTAAFAALGFSATATATPAPLRVGGPPFTTATIWWPGHATNTVSGTPAKPVPIPRAAPRSRASISRSPCSMARAPTSRRSGISCRTSRCMPRSRPTPTIRTPSAQVTALSQRIAANLAPQNGQQSIQDIQAEFAGAQTAIKAATDRQTQLKGMAQTMLDSIEGINQDEVATKILALQTSLQASYQTTAMLYQTTLTKYLPIG